MNIIRRMGSEAKGHETLTVVLILNIEQGCNANVWDDDVGEYFAEAVLTRAADVTCGHVLTVSLESHIATRFPVTQQAHHQSCKHSQKYKLEPRRHWFPRARDGHYLTVCHP